jgi:hypothetical protein
MKNETIDTTLNCATHMHDHPTGNYSWIVIVYFDHEIFTANTISDRVTGFFRIYGYLFEV